MRKLEEILEIAKSKYSKRIVVADATEEEVLAALDEAKQNGVARGILVGDSNLIKKTLRQIGSDPKGYEIIDEPNSAKTAKIAVELLKSDKADVLMKGLVSTKAFMKAILDKKEGLLERSSKGLLSHVAVFEIPEYHKLLTITDAAINIAPDLTEKAQIIQNAVNVVHSLGVEKPKVACVCSVEKVNPQKMPTTEHAAILSQMSIRGQIKNCIVDGPFGFDNAINKKAAYIKGIVGDVAGDADVILAPEIESANILYKSLLYFGNSCCAAVVAGTQIPIVLTSRTDPHKTKFYSLVLGIIISQSKKS